MDDPNAEAGLSLGKMQGAPGKALWWPSLAAAWKPLLIMAEAGMGVGRAAS